MNKKLSMICEFLRNGSTDYACAIYIWASGMLNKSLNWQVANDAYALLFLHSSVLLIFSNINLSLLNIALTTQ